MTTKPATDAGFTLIETLVALAVLAVGSVTLLVGVERHAAGVRGLSDRIVARWVAENAIAAATLGVPMEERWTQAFDINWSVMQDVQRLGGTGLQSITFRVADAAAGSEAALVALTAYLSPAEVRQ